VAEVVLEGTLTCCMIESVVVEPWPSSHASHVPNAAVHALVLLITLLSIALLWPSRGLDWKIHFRIRGC